MSLYNKKLSISMPWAIVVVTGLLLAILGWLTIILADKPFLAKEGPLWVFASGMASGLVVTLAQFCLSWADAAPSIAFGAWALKTSCRTATRKPTMAGSFSPREPTSMFWARPRHA
jgi:hypothetical protein